ncbi:MAG: HD domain-containing protein [Gemmataceae bacterium]|nr:HD domain-containing protein [Gemmataceae bacterium]
MIENNLANEGHWRRIIRYVRALAGAVVEQGEYARLKDDAYLELLAAIAPVYDIGMVAIPRGLLIKPDKLSEDEVAVVQTHVTVGADVMLSVAAKLGSELPFLPLAAEIVRHHHEHWDGSGYPDMLKGSEIPLSARVVALVSVYEALRSRRPYRPALSHARAVKLILHDLHHHFDPVLLNAFHDAAARFEQIHIEG